jgi:hypothetical protein
MPSKAGKPSTRCRWTSQADALAAFAGFGGKTESAAHIKPLHWYVACRLVVEGGFDPEAVTPRPPFRVQQGATSRKVRVLHFDETAAGGGERTVLGGLKTKDVDVVVTHPHLGPVLAVSCKGTVKSFRNLTNRLEETIGECTNLHITYPALVLGYLPVLRANRRAGLSLAQIEAGGPDTDVGDGLTKNDLALAEDGSVVVSIRRFHDALSEMQGRRGIRNDLSRYEAIGLGLVDMDPAARGTLVGSYPERESALRLEQFFPTLYRQYDERFVVRAPDLASTTRRHAWAADSPGLKLPGLDYSPRVGAAWSAGGESVG